MPRFPTVPLFAACALLALTGCDAGGGGPGSATYPLPPATAQHRLQHADLRAFATAEQCAIPLTVTAVADGPAAVTLRITDGVFELAEASIHLDPDGAGGVRPAIQMPADPDGGEIYDGNHHYPRPGLRQPVRAALQELIDATLGGRAFDGARVRAAQPADGLCTPAPPSPPKPSASAAPPPAAGSGAPPDGVIPGPPAPTLDNNDQPPPMPVTNDPPGSTPPSM